MQVVFTIEEFRLLVHILREQSETDLQPATSLKASAAALLEKVLARDFGFSLDELEDLEAILHVQEDKVRHAMDAAGRSAETEHEEQVLEHVLDRVTEACAMG